MMLRSYYFLWFVRNVRNLILNVFITLIFLSVGGRTILKWILERKDGMEWIGLIWLRIGTSGGLL
jgi:hypothetical protein